METYGSLAAFLAEFLGLLVGHGCGLVRWMGFGRGSWRICAGGDANQDLNCEVR